MGLPPVGRMRAIKAAATEHREDLTSRNKLMKDPPPAIFKKKVVPKPVPKPERKVEVDVGIMKVRVTPGPDKKFGTPDDKVDITPKNTTPKAPEAKTVKIDPLPLDPTVNEIRVYAALQGIELPKRATKAALLAIVSKDLADADLD